MEDDEIVGAVRLAIGEDFSPCPCEDETWHLTDADFERIIRQVIRLVREGDA